MSFPYSNRSLKATITELALKKGSLITIKEIIDDLGGQFDHLGTTFECVQYVAPRDIRLTFRSSEVMEDFHASGATFRGHPLNISSIHNKQWVNITRLPYGIPSSAVSAALRPFGETEFVKPEKYKGIPTGTQQALVTIKHPIPSRLRIQGHLCNVFYRGQTRTCYRCNQSGHISKTCPGNARNDGDRATNLHAQTTSGAQPGTFVPSTLADRPRSYADSVAMRSPGPDATDPGLWTAPPAIVNTSTTVLTSLEDSIAQGMVPTTVPDDSAILSASGLTVPGDNSHVSDHVSPLVHDNDITDLTVPPVVDSGDKIIKAVAQVPNGDTVNTIYTTPSDPDNTVFAIPQQEAPRIGKSTPKEGAKSAMLSSDSSDDDEAPPKAKDWITIKRASKRKNSLSSPVTSDPSPPHQKKKEDNAEDMVASPRTTPSGTSGKPPPRTGTPSPRKPTDFIPSRKSTSPAPVPTGTPRSSWFYVLPDEVPIPVSPVKPNSPSLLTSSGHLAPTPPATKTKGPPRPVADSPSSGDQL